MNENNFERARAWLRKHNIQRLTWGDVDAYIREYHLDDDEYFEAHTVYRHHHPDWTRWIIR